MRVLGWLLLIILLPSVGLGQVVVTTSQILSTAKHQSQFSLQARKLDFLKTTPHHLPIIDRWEFRTQTHDLDLSEQRFTFRIRPNSRKERNGQQQLHLSTIQLYQEESRAELLAVIQKRYDVCLTLLFAKERKRIMEDLATVYEELNLIQEGQLNFSELIDAEELQQEYLLQLFDYEQIVVRAVRKAQYFIKEQSNIDLERADFITINTLKERIGNVNPLEPLANPSLSLLEQEINVVDREIDFTIARQKKWFSFAQIRYGGSDMFTPFRETFNVAFAFQLPVKGNTILKTNQLNLEKIKAENEWGKAYYQIEKERKNLLREIHKFLEKHDNLTQNLVAVQDKMTNSYSVKQADDYEVLSLKIRAYLLKKKLRLHKLEEKIYRTYIEWLAVTGKMVELPLVNYLSHDLKPY